MIGKLQVKFIAITMVAVIILTACIYGVIIFQNYESINEQLNGIIDVIIQNDGVIPEYRERRGFITPETKYSTRYFTIKIDNNNEIIETDTKYIATVTQENAKEIKDNVLKTKKIAGYYENYRYKIAQKDGYKLIVFLDATMQLNTVQSTIEQSLAIIGYGLILIFVVDYAISKRVLQPIIKNVEKQKQFITNASHELKTPLAVINADLDVLEMTVGDDNEWIDSIKNQISRLNILIRSLLSLANIEEERSKMQLSEFSIRNVINEELQEFKALLQDKNVEFDNKKEVFINADINLIKQLITILLDNSIKYTPDNGTIKITAERHGKNTKIEIANTCEDVKKIDTKKLFDRFYRNDKSRNKKKEGYGIGLSIAKSIVDVHKGKISVYINKDDMICFKIII